MAFRGGDDSGLLDCRESDWYHLSFLPAAPEKKTRFPVRPRVYSSLPSTWVTWGDSKQKELREGKSQKPAGAKRLTEDEM